MVRFYGLGFEEVMEMSSTDFETLSKCMIALEHQDMLVNMKVASYPHLKTDTAGKLHKEIYKKAFPSELDNTKPLSMEEAEKALGRLTNG